MGSDATPVTAASAPASTALDVVRDVLAPGDGRSVDYRLVGRGRPRFLLPADASVAAAACTHYNALRGWRTRWNRRLTAAAVRLGVDSLLGSRVTLSGASSVAPGEQQSLLDYLSTQLDCEVVAAVGLSEVDAYWTPVLQLFRAEGSPAGFAKIGWTPVTHAFIEREWAAAVALQRGNIDLIAPEPLHRGSWGDLDISVLAPMPLAVTARPVHEVPPVPREIETLDGPVVERMLHDSEWWMRARAAVDASASVSGLPPLDGLCDRVLRQFGDEPIRCGRIHGDWVPWNLGDLDGELVAWDWEYSEPDSPLGIDEVHGRYQVARLLQGKNDVDAFAASGATGTAALLHPLMVLSRRCWTSLMTGRPDGLTELTAAAQVLRARLGDRDGSTP